MAECKDLIPSFCGATKKPFVDFCEEEDGRTILWSNGMLTLNMTDEQIEEYSQWATIVKRYPTYSDNDPYNVTVNIEYDSDIGADAIVSVYGQPWDNERRQIGNVNLNGVYPESIEGWFYGTSMTDFRNDDDSPLNGCKNIRAAFAESDIDGAFIDFANLENASYAFQNCKNLEAVELCSTNVSNMQECVQMFYGCDALRTIHAPDFPLACNGRQMFEGMINIDACTPYDPDHVDQEYAVPDQHCSSYAPWIEGPGYFTLCD